MQPEMTSRIGDEKPGFYEFGVEEREICAETGFLKQESAIALSKKQEVLALDTA